MKKIISLILLLFFISNIGFSQKRKTLTVYPAYELNLETIKVVVGQVVVNLKSDEVSKYILKYPVLEDIKDFNKKAKYSMINDSLIVLTTQDEKYFVFHLVNDIVYRIKKSKRINTKIK